MNAAALNAEIRNRSDCASLIAARDLDGIAALVSAGRAAIQSRFVTARTILAECGQDGPGILDALQTASANNSAIKWALTFLGQDGGLDVGHPVTQGMIDALAAAGALTGAQALALKSLAMQPATVSRADVEAALYNPDGTEK